MDKYQWAVVAISVAAIAEAVIIYVATATNRRLNEALTHRSAELIRVRNQQEPTPVEGLKKNVRRTGSQRVMPGTARRYTNHGS